MLRKSFIFGLMLIVLLVMSTNLIAVDYYVDPSGTDDGSHGSGTGTDAWATIEYAVNNVSDPETETIIIYVAAGIYNLYHDGNTDPIDIAITFNNLTIQGASEGSTIIQGNTSAAAANSYIFDIYADGSFTSDVTLKDMTIRYGNYSNSGSGIIINDETLTLTNCTISGNEGTNSAGGIYNDGGNLTMNNCTVSGNSTNNNEDAGGILNRIGTLEMNNCTVSENTCGIDYAGGGIYNYAGGGTSTITMNNCTISGNDGGWAGGGIYNDTGASLTMTNCTVSGNSASDGDVDWGDGGGILNSGGTVTLTNCTVSGNHIDATSDGYGGGYCNYSGTLIIKNTIIANNTNGAGNDDYYYYAGTLTDNGYNIVEYQSGASTGLNKTFTAITDILYNTKANGTTGYSAWNRNNTDLPGADLYLSSTLDLNNNPNGTETLTYTNGSSIGIDDGTSTQGTHPELIPTTDQRGASIYNSTKDIGSYEWQGSPGTLPVELSAFTAQYLNSKPTLYWQTQSEEDNMGWFIYRNIVEDFTSSEKISGMLPGHGTTTQPQSYIYEDAEQLQVEQTYYYWLESVDYSGTIHHFDMVAHITISHPNDPGQNITPPVAYEITADPNPFSQITEITFAMSQTSLVDVAIYNLKGQLVKSFDTVMTNADEDVSFQWNGKDDSGKSLSNGVYLYSVKVNGKDYATKQLILMK